MDILKKLGILKITGHVIKTKLFYYNLIQFYFYY